MNIRPFLLAVLILFSSTFEPSHGQSDTIPTAAEQRLIDDLRALPVPEDARFSELLTRDFAMMMTSGAPTDDPQSIYPGLRLLLFALPRSCSGLESFYQQHWPGFKFPVDSSSGSTEYRTFLGWQGDELKQLQVNSIEDIDDSAEGVLLMVSEHSANAQNSLGFDPTEVTRGFYGIPNDTDWCSVFMINSRKVNLSDIPLSVRGLSSGDVYSSVTGLFNVIVPSADNFAVDRFSVLETSEQEGPLLVEEVSFLIGDFGELYRAGVVQLNQQFASLAEAITEASTADELAQVPLARHFRGELPGEIELINTEKVTTDYGQAVQALYRVEKGSQLLKITNFDPPEPSAPGDALVAVTAVQIGNHLIFATAQNDYLSSEGDENVSTASIASKAINLMNLLTWSRDLPGNAKLPINVMSPLRRPHQERCARQYSTDDGVAFENTCGRQVAFQILMNPDEDNVAEYVIQSGETLRLADQERRFAFTVCPSGSEVDRIFDRENLSSILASQYNCSQREAEASTTTR